MDQQKCSVYRQPRDRPAKRQKVESSGLDSSMQLRKRAYKKGWTERSEQIEIIRRELDEPLLSQFTGFIESRASLPGQIQTGVLLGSLGGASNDSILYRMRRHVKDDKRTCFILISSSDAPNLKTLLRVLNQKATSVEHDLDDEDIDERSTSPRKLLPYDLQILHEWCQARGVQQVVVAFQDAEAFETGVLSEVLLLFNSWADRIAFKCVLGLSTSIEIFQARLPRSVLRHLRSTIFSSPQDKDILETVFERLATNENSSIWIGPSVADAVLQRQQDHMQSVEDLKQQLKYVHMSHFFANPLTAFLGSGGVEETLSVEHFQAVRSLASFQRLVEGMVAAGELQTVKTLFSSDETLEKVLKTELEASKRRAVWASSACLALKMLRGKTFNKAPVPFMAMYSRAFSGNLKQSTLVRETLLTLKKIDPPLLLDLLPKVLDILFVMPASVVDISPDDFRDLLEEVQRGDPKISKAAMLDAECASAGKRRVPKRDASQTAAQVDNASLAERFVELLKTYFDRALVSMTELPFNEILFYDLKSPHRDVFMPRPRAAIERALSAPQDYLGCQCCGQSQEGLRPTQPATAVLYQLYLESGALINAFDLWSAFSAVVQPTQPSEKATMSLFFRALAELKYMGLIKPSQRRTDHLAKLAWKGI